MRTLGRRIPRALGLGVAGAVALAAPPARAQLFLDQGDAKLGAQACGGSGCWTNYARVVDVDTDGDLDLVGVNCGGFFGPVSAQPLTVHLNDGAGTFTDGAALFGAPTIAARQIAFGDIDGDGDVDVALPSAGNAGPDRLYVRGPSGFVDEAATRLPAGLSSNAGAARFADVDADGDLDLLVADGYNSGGAPPAHLYRNDGTGKFVEAVGALPTSKNGGANPDDLDVADVDGDFDLDVYVSLHQGPNLLWINDGAGTFADATSALPALSPDANFHYGPVFCDVDNDGDADLFVDNTADGYQEQLLINDGTGQFTDETAARITGNLGADDNLVACLDFDGDDDLDFVVGALGPGQERLFANDGTGRFARVDGAFDGPQDPTLWLDFGDLDGDGRLDAFTAQGEGQPQLERVYLGGMGVVVDTLGPRTRLEAVTTSPSTATPVRFAVRDNAITDDGPRIARAWVEFGSDWVPAKWVGGDLYRAVVPPTPVLELRACAEDLRGNITPGCGTGEPTGASSSGAGGASTSGAGGAPTSGAGGSGTGGLGDDQGPFTDEGCGCVVGVGARTSDGVSRWGAWLGVALAAWFTRSRRRSPAQSSAR
jgi:hypothetical protein